MSFLIDPDIDAYGTKGRITCLTDYFEVAALNGINYSISEMGDLIKDNGWDSLPLSNIKHAGADYEEVYQSDRVEDWEIILQGTIEQRNIELGSKYPFKIESNRLVEKPYDDLHLIYIELLGISFLHGNKIYERFSLQKLSSIFELSVTECLSQKGLNGKNFGTAGGSSGNFPERLKNTFEGTGLIPKEEIIFNRYAKDEKVDTIGGIFWKDNRKLNQHWIFLGQSTIAKSDEWERKMIEINLDRWKEFLDSRILPQGFLAVPYHIDNEHLKYMVQGRVVLDRINLVSELEGISRYHFYEYIKNISQSVK